MVLYPGETPGIFPLKIGNLTPNSNYKVLTKTSQVVRSDHKGDITLNLPIHHRTEINFTQENEY